MGNSELVFAHLALAVCEISECENETDLAIRPFININQPCFFWYIFPLVLITAIYYI